MAWSSRVQRSQSGSFASSGFKGKDLPPRGRLPVYDTATRLLRHEGVVLGRDPGCQEPRLGACCTMAAAPHDPFPVRCAFARALCGHKPLPRRRRRRRCWCGLLARLRWRRRRTIRFTGSRWCRPERLGAVLERPVRKSGCCGCGAGWGCGVRVWGDGGGP